MPRNLHYFKLALLAFALNMVFTTITNAAQSKAIEVIYPDLQEPYRSVVTTIIEGIKEQIKGPVDLFAVGDNADPAQLKASMEKEEMAAIIALGKTGLDAVLPWKGKIPIIAGALLLTPDKNDRGIAGISLVAAPELFFSYLGQIAPSVKRVHIVYSPQNSAWIVQAANLAARKINLQLITHQSDDIRNSALIYNDIINKTRPGEDALWLLPDPVAVDNKVILPLLLRGAWDNGILIFSSNPAYVNRGALFALFPDNKGMGKDLAEMAEAYVNNDKKNIENNIVFLRAFKAAINVRTAEHTGLSISKELKNKFSLVFPAPSS